MLLFIKDGIGPTGINLEILEFLTTLVGGLEAPWMIGADWNMSPEQLEAT